MDRPDRSSRYRAPLDRALTQALSHLDDWKDAAVAASATLSALRARLARPLADEGADAVWVLDDLVADCAGGILGSASGRFFGWVIGGAVLAALAADWLNSAWDQNAAGYGAAPPEAVIEEVCGDWFKELLGLPATASFALVTGSQMAHVTCLAARPDERPAARLNRARGATPRIGNHLHCGSAER